MGFGCPAHDGPVAASREIYWPPLQRISCLLHAQCAGACRREGTERCLCFHRASFAKDYAEGSRGALAAYGGPAAHHVSALAQSGEGSPRSSTRPTPFAYIHDLPAARRAELHSNNRPNGPMAIKRRTEVVGILARRHRQPRRCDSAALSNKAGPLERVRARSAGDHHQDSLRLLFDSKCGWGSLSALR